MRTPSGNDLWNVLVTLSYTHMDEKHVSLKSLEHSTDGQEDLNPEHGIQTREMKD